MTSKKPTDNHPVQVDFYGTYRLISGKKTIEFPITPGETILDLLNAITTRFPPLRHEILDGHGILFAYIPLFLNGRNPRLLKTGVHTIIQPLDILSLFSPISSGAINVEEIKQSLSS